MLVKSIESLQWGRTKFSIFEFFLVTIFSEKTHLKKTKIHWLLVYLLFKRFKGTEMESFFPQTSKELM